jgi:hypothetical protein
VNSPELFTSSYVYLRGDIETPARGGEIESGVVQAAVIPLAFPELSMEITITAGFG